jgi:hypothetical protein
MDPIVGEGAMLLWLMRAATSRRKRFGNHTVRPARLASMREYNLKDGSYRIVTALWIFGSKMIASESGFRIMLNRV